MMASKYPDVLNTLSSAKNITILAPSNEAFIVMMTMPQVRNLTEDAVKALLDYHILDGTYPSSEITDKPAFLPTMMGKYKPFRNLGDDEQIVKAVLGKNDTALIYGGLDMAANVTKADIKFEGGVIHMLNSVLVPPMLVSETIKALNLTGLATALNQTMMVDKIDMMAKQTIFAPSNDAFNAMKDELAGMDKDEVSKVLSYHVVPDTVAYSSTLKDDLKVKTLNGESLTIRIVDGKVYVNDREVTTPDILTNTGVVHVIDGLLSPSAPEAAPNKPDNSTTSGPSSPPGQSSGSRYSFSMVAVSLFVAAVAFGIAA
jgi:uncharacterized surface protein with fasciclin (FAS1) repeats